MKFVIRGIQVINRTKQDGTQTSGCNLFLTYADRNTVGEACRTEYIGSNSDAYNVIRPYLANNIDKLIGANCSIDFDVRQYGEKMYKSVIGFELLRSDVK